MYSLYLTISFFFFFNDTATTEIYTLSLHDALPISQRREPHAFRGQLASGQLAGEAKAHDLVSGQRPGPQRALLSPTVHQRLQQPPGALAHVERTDAFGAVDLVRRDRDEVERERVHIERHLARGLGAIAVQGDKIGRASCRERV